MSNLGAVIGAFFQTGFFPAFLIGFAMWNADKAISKDGAKLLSRELTATAADPSNSRLAAAIVEFLETRILTRQSFGRLLWNVLVLSATSLVVILLIYAYKTPGLTAQLSSEGFLRQFFGNGMVVVYLVNLSTFLLFRPVVDSMAHAGVARGMAIAIAEIVVKAALFVALTLITYILFAVTTGAFDGSIENAIGAVRPTIQGAFAFRNLTAVYFYSVLISAFPVWLVIGIRILAGDAQLARFARSLWFWLPFDEKPLRAVSLAFAISAGIFAFVVSLVMAPI